MDATPRPMRLALTTEDRERMEGCAVVVSLSGGKDSAALSLWLRELGVEHKRVFADTGWEHDLTYEYIFETLVPRLGPVEVVRAKRQMVEMIRHKGVFPSRVMRWCTQELKLRPLARWFKALDDDPVNVVGVRGEESAKRARMPRWEYNKEFDCDVWRPAIGWTKRDVIDLHTRHGLPPNPLYLMGAERVGCWPCVQARKTDIRLMAEHTPERVDLIRRLEAEVDAHQRERHDYEAKGYHPPAWFVCRRPMPGSNGRMLPVDAAVEWSRTARGGRQLEMFDDGRGACVEWGLCEALPAAAE